MQCSLITSQLKDWLNWHKVNSTPIIFKGLYLVHDMTAFIKNTSFDWNRRVHFCWRIIITDYIFYQSVFYFTFPGSSTSILPVMYQTILCFSEVSHIPLPMLCIIMGQKTFWRFIFPSKNPRLWPSFLQKYEAKAWDFWGHLNS